MPSLEERTLPEISVRIFNPLRALDKKNSIDRLMDIAEDNDAILADLKEIIKGGMQLSIYCRGEGCE